MNPLGVFLSTLELKPQWFGKGLKLAHQILPLPHPEVVEKLGLAESSEGG